MFGKYRMARVLWLALAGLLAASCAPLTVGSPGLGASRPSALPAAEPPSQPFLRIETGMHTATIIRIAGDAAGRYLVTGSDDKTARVWELATGQLLQVLRPPQGEGQEGRVYAVALSPDGASVAVGGWTGYAWDQQCSIYLFDRASGKLLLRLPGLPTAIIHLCFSPDGQHLAAALGKGGGVRVYHTSDWKEVMADPDYGDRSNSVDFDATGRLVATCLDGSLRLYDASFQRIARRPAPGGKQPLRARFSPDGRQVAVGFADSTAVSVLSGEDLSFLYAPDTAGVDNGSLGSVAWSQDGRFLYAGGRYRGGPGWDRVLCWGEAGRGPVQRWRASTNTILDLKSLSEGRLAFGAADPVWGVLDAQGQRVIERRGEILDHRDNEEKLLLSPEGAVVEFGFKTLTSQGEWSVRRARFEVASARLSLDPPAREDLQAPRTEGEAKENWEHTTTPRVRGQALTLEPYETSRSLALAPDGPGFLLGTDWSLRYYDDPTSQRWEVPVPGTAWAVNLSPDGRYAVAALGDGTLRWFDAKDGKEVLALFVHPDGERWIAWTPQGFFHAAPGGESLIGYHLNQGKDRAGEFVAAEQLKEQFYRPDLIAQRLSPEGEKALAESVRRLGDVRQILAGGLPPKLELLSPEESDSEGEYLLKVRIQDQGGGVGRIIYRIDGVEVQGRPADIPGAGADTVGRQFSLATGKRVISMTVANRRGVESKPVQAVVNVTAPRERPALHVLAVGVTDYYDSDLRLKYAAADAQTLASELGQHAQPIFPRGIRAIVRTDQDATVEKIDKAFKDLAREVRPEDTFILYLSGHGQVLDGRYYFLPWEIEYENEEALRRQGLSEEKLRELLSRMPVQALLLLDTCRSGTALQLAAKAAEDKGAITRLMTTSNRAVIAASTAQGMALEGYEGHGVFTYAILQALDQADYDKDERVDVDELAMHVRKVVPEITQKCFKYRQVPMRELHGATFPIAKP